MTKRALALAFATFCVVIALPPRLAFAYIDPGTTQVFWTSLAPFLTVLLGCPAVLLWPARVALRWLLAKWKTWAVRAKISAVLVSAVVLGGAALGIVWLVSGGGTGTGPKDEVRKVKFERVIVLGIDGFDPGILERMMDEGRLPNFAKLRKEGTFARLQTSIPPESPVAWLSAATGVNPGRHGVFDFINRDPKKYLPDLSILRTGQKGLLGLSGGGFVPASSRQTFWDILSQHGVKVSVIRWPVTFPPQPVNGRLLSGLGAPDVAGTLGRYRFYTTAPIAPDDKAPDRVSVVSWSDGTISTELPGPQVLSLSGGKASAVPLCLERSKDGTAVTMAFGKSSPVALSVGEWSEWMPIEFPGGMSRACPAIVRAYLTSVTPELGLYVTPPQIDPRHPAYPISHPAEFAGELADDIGLYHTLGMPEDGQAVLHGRIPLAAFLDECNGITRERELMLERELKRFDKGLLAIVFDTSDRVQHMFWAATDRLHPAHTPELERDFGRVIGNHYERMDAVLGSILRASTKGTAVYVMSDHGFAGFDRAVHLNTWLVRNGFMTLKASDGEEGAALFKSVDWSRTRAYAAGFCSLYINVKGREKQGIVAEGKERQAAAEELSRALKAWTDPKTGKAIVRNVYLRDETYQGEYLDQAPDLVIGYYPGYRASWQTAVGAGPSGDAIVDNAELWAGDHLVDGPAVPGIFLSNVKCRNMVPRIIDIAPTVLQSFDVAVPPDTDGKPLL